MTIKEVFKKAIEGGLDAEEIFNEDDEIKALANPELFYLDPLFWQSLGRAGVVSPDWKNYKDGTMKLATGRTLWQQTWVDFVDHLAEGGTPESFFNQL